MVGGLKVDLFGEDEVRLKDDGIPVFLRDINTETYRKSGFEFQLLRLVVWL